MSIRKNKLQKHAIFRARQRYSLRLSREDLEAIVCLIQQGQTVPAKSFSQKAGHDKYMLEYKGRLIRVSYFEKLGVVSTFLPLRKRDILDFNKGDHGFTIFGRFYLATLIFSLLHLV